MGEAEAVVHTASLHAPHVGVRSDREFERVNLHALETLLELALARGVVCFVYTSTTAVYGDAVVDSACRWIDEQVEPIPRTIYHRTKLAAEAMVAGATSSTLRTRVLRMSRCFPEAADQMAVYRLHRGVDVRDVADAHALALADGRSGHQLAVVSGHTPFRRADASALAHSAAEVIGRRAPSLARAFRLRAWALPSTIDRIYDATHARRLWGWRSRYGYREVLNQLDRRSLEVLPPVAAARDIRQQ